MESKIHNLAFLSYIDELLEDLQEEYGDLPERVKEKEKKYADTKAMKEETDQILNDIKEFCSASKVTLMDLKNKEEKLSKQQFKVRNNKEFDAVTKEIEHIRNEHKNLTEKLRTEGIKQENLQKIMDEQTEKFEEAKTELEEARKEMETVASDQDDELKELYQKRKDLVKKIKPEDLEEYERIRQFHSNPVVKVDRNSCSGCFSAVPPQKIVEIRNNLDTIFFCESCGRMLYPGEIEVNDEVIETI